MQCNMNLHSVSIYFKKQTKKKTSRCWMFFQWRDKNSNVRGVIYGVCFFVVLPSCSHITYENPIGQIPAGMQSPYFMTTFLVKPSTDMFVVPIFIGYLGRQLGSNSARAQDVSGICWQCWLTWIWHKTVLLMWLAGIFHDCHGHLGQTRWC